MTRYALGLEYDGTAFMGWQRQTHPGRTVQACLEEALAKVADHPLEVTCAGRTDAGVHARGQRFSAEARQYCYVILNRQTRPALNREALTWVHQPLDVRRMSEAALHLLGRHDFSAFRSVDCQAKQPVRTLKRLDVRREGEQVIIDVVADGFLHHMVRNITGVLLAVGEGKKAASWAREVLEGRDRTLGGVTAPACGLSLMAVSYPERYNIPLPEGALFSANL